MTRLPTVRMAIAALTVILQALFIYHVIKHDKPYWWGFFILSFPIIGCIVYPAAEVSEPGVVQHVEGDRFSLGEPDGVKSERTSALAAALVAAGLRAPVRPRPVPHPTVGVTG